MQISKRLEAVAAMVTSGCTVADIGTDHGYIPIYLMEEGKIRKAVAMDVNRGPLARAEENIRRHRLEERIETRLSDGLAALKPREAESIVIAGMGGPLTVRILTEGRERLDGCQELILQPQSELRQVRAFLEQSGWELAEERAVREDGKFYFIMRAVPGHTGEGETEKASGTVEKERREEERKPLREYELRYGPVLLARRDQVLFCFLEKERETERRILESLEGQGKEAARRRREEVRRNLSLIEEALQQFDGSVPWAEAKNCAAEHTVF